MNDGYVKGPDAALRFIPPFGKLRAGSVPVTVSLSNRARLACDLFTKPSHFQDFLRGRHE
jgi:hypothetical protein